MTQPSQIMIVEDNPTNLMLLQQMVEHLGHQVVPAINGQICLDRLTSGTHVDMILMDLNMPGICGLEATRQIRGLSREANSLPIIAVTASVHAECRQDAWQAGLNDFITKPIHLDVLTEVVAGWLSDCPPVVDGLNRLEVPVFDANTLDEMLEDLDEETVSILVEEFCGEIDSRLTAVIEAANAGDAGSLKATCHALKSSSGTFGAVQLSRLCQAVELAALGGADDTALKLAVGLAPLGNHTTETLTARGAA